MFGASDVTGCEVRVDDGPWQPMHRADGDRRYRAAIEWPPGARRLSVRAADIGGRIGTDAIEPAGDAALIPTSKGIGSDADAIGAWPEKGLLGTQLGPNRNGRHW